LEPELAASDPPCLPPPKTLAQSRVRHKRNTKTFPLDIISLLIGNFFVIAYKAGYKSISPEFGIWLLQISPKRGEFRV
jgi:hypothetical protein